MESMNTVISRKDEIDFKDMLRHVLLHWRSLIIAALIGAVLVCGLLVVKDVRSRNAETTEEGLTLSEQKFLDNIHYVMDLTRASAEYEKQVDKARTYQAESILMQIDPKNEAFSVSRFIITVDGEENGGKVEAIEKLYEDKLLSGTYLDDLAAGMNTTREYLAELLEVELSIDARNRIDLSPLTSSGTMEVGVIGPDKELTDNIMAAVVEEVDRLKAEITAVTTAYEIQASSEESYVRIDTDLEDQQRAIYERMVSLQANKTKNQTNIDNMLSTLGMKAKEIPASYAEMEEREAELLENFNRGLTPKKIVMGLAVGCIAGLLVMAAIWYINYARKKRFDTAGMFFGKYNLRILGIAERKQTKKNTALDLALRKGLKDEGDPWGEELFKKIMSGIANYLPDGKNIMVTGYAQEEQIGELAGFLQQNMTGYNVVCAPKFPDSGERLGQLREADGVVLVEERGVSEYDRIETEIFSALGSRKEIVGAVIV